MVPGPRRAGRPISRSFSTSGSELALGAGPPIMHSHRRQVRVGAFAQAVLGAEVLSDGGVSCHWESRAPSRSSTRATGAAASTRATPG